MTSENARIAGVLNLFTLEEEVKDKASIGKHVAWEVVRLLHTARIWLASLAHVGITETIKRAIWHAIRVFGSNVCCWRM
jgi:hypothetical protein